MLLLMMTDEYSIVVILPPIRKYYTVQNIMALLRDYMQSILKSPRTRGPPLQGLYSMTSGGGGSSQ